MILKLQKDTVLFFINLLLFSLFYANILALFEFPIWLGLFALLPVWLARSFFAPHGVRILLSYAWVSLLVGMVVIVVLILQKLLFGHNIIHSVLLPLLVAVVMLYVLYLYLSWQQVQATNHKDAQHFTFWVVGPSLVMSFAVAVIFAVYFLFVLSILAEHNNWLAPIARKFIDRGIIPPITLVFFCWAMLILISKWVLLRIGHQLFFASGQLVSATEKIGMKSKEIVELLWQYSAESYLIPKYLNWSVPILGFIGTVLGISLAADGIQRIIVSQDGLSQLSSDLGAAIAPLGIAFDTTLIALSLSILLTLFQTLQQRSEDRLLHAIMRKLASD